MTGTTPNEAMPSTTAAPGRLVVAISARALFDLEAGHELFERDGVAAYASYQREREDEVLEPGIAFPLVRKLLALNRIERFLAGQRVALHPQFAHFLERRSYAKALAWIEAGNPVERGLGDHGHVA